MRDCTRIGHAGRRAIEFGCVDAHFCVQSVPKKDHQFCNNMGRELVVRLIAYRRRRRRKHTDAPTRAMSHREA